MNDAPEATPMTAGAEASNRSHRLRLLIEDVDLLIDHLGRHRPGRLDACFDDSRGDLQRPANVPAPPFLRPGTPASKAEFLRRWAEISVRTTAPGTAALWLRSAPRPDARPQVADSDDAGQQGWVDDMVFLVAARDFLAALAFPATVSMIRLTTAYVRRSAQSGRAWRRLTEPKATSGHDLRSDEALGYRLAATVTTLRWFCLATVILTLLVSLMAFGGKRLLQEQDRWLAFLGAVAGDIATEQATPARSATPAVVTDGQLRAPEHAYCDEPFLLASGSVLYATARQEALCNRLWGINRTVNQLNGHLEAWGDSFIATPFRWLTGLASGAGDGRVRIFAEAARPANHEDAMRFLGWRPGTAASPEIRAQALGLAARSQEKSDTLQYLSERHRPAGSTSPTQAKAMIEALSLYVMPCFYALLGAFVAVFQDLARRTANFTLERSERDQAMATLLYGVVFGALVGILADMLRTQPISGAAGDEVVLGVSVFALLAGYSVAHVFRFLDGFADRVFGAPRAERAGIAA